MNAKNMVKKVWHLLYRFFRGAYRLFYAKPVILYKMRHDAAINDFYTYSSFDYKSDSYYPAIVRKGKQRIDKIYARIVKLDESGIPYVPRLEQKYWPVTIVQYGLVNYNFYLQYRESQFHNRVTAVCGWLIGNISESGTWQHTIALQNNSVNEHIQPPFASAMVQGEAISLLVREYILTGNERCLACASKALQPFERHVSKGGVYDEIFGMPFYEEYPTTTPSLVLNGFLFSLFGLYDLAQMKCEAAQRAKQLFDRGSDTLVHVLPMYDGGFCSRYDLSHITAAPHNDNKNPFYHPIHINLLIAINSILKSDVIDHYIREWR